MGNKNSSPQNNSNNSDLNVSAESTSGVFLSDQLQADLVSSFQSSILQQQWNLLQTDILSRRNERLSKEVDRKVQVEEELMKWRAQNEQLQANLDDSMDTLKAKFNDLAVSMQYDTNKLVNSIGKSMNKKGKAQDSCVDIRSALVSCCKQVQDLRKCDAEVAALEQCVKNVVMSSS